MTREDREVVAAVLHPTEPGDEDDVAEDVPLAEEIDRLQPLDGRHAVALDDLIELEDRLAGVQRERHAASGRTPRRLMRRSSSVQVSTCERREEALDAAVRRAIDALDELHRPPEARFARLLVPLVLHLLAVARQPAPGAVAIGDVGAHAAALGGGGGVVALAADLHHRRRARADQFGHRVVNRGVARRLVNRRRAHRQHLGEAGHRELPPPAILDERFVERRLAQMRVRVDEPRRDDLVARVDDAVHLPAECPAHMDDLIALDDDAPVLQDAMPALLIGHDHPAVDPRPFCHVVSPQLDGANRQDALFALIPSPLPRWGRGSSFPGGSRQRPASAQ